MTMSNYSLVSDLEGSHWMMMSNRMSSSSSSMDSSSSASSSSWSSVWATFTTADLLITIAYFSIPLQLLFSLYKFPQLITMPLRLVVLLVLFAFFIFLCGAGHLTRHIGTVTMLQERMQHEQLLLSDPTAAEISSSDQPSTVWMSVFVCINNLTAIVSVTTALYLLPLIPSLFSTIDSAINESHQLHLETAASKDKLVSFMAFLCHEIRNPLFAITSSVQSLKEDYHWTGEPQASMECIHDASLLMLRLVNDVLDLSKMDAGKLTLEDRNFDVWRLLSNLETCMDKQIERRHQDRVQLDFDVDRSTVPRILYGDSTRMLQIAYNLLSNSVKFTSHGTIRFRVRVLPRNDKRVPSSTDASATASAASKQRKCHSGRGEDADDTNSTASSESDCIVHEGGSDTQGLLDHEFDLEQGARHHQHQHHHHQQHQRELVHLEITCQDSGTGIAPDRLDTIFEPYSQAKLSDYRKHGGTGLGLSIISSLIKLMGGSISVESTVGEGSTFRLVVPVWAPTHPHQIDVDIDEDDDDDDDEDEGSMLASDPLRATRRLPVYTASALDDDNDNDEGERSKAISSVEVSSPRSVTGCVRANPEALLAAHLDSSLTVPPRSIIPMVSTSPTTSHLVVSRRDSVCSSVSSDDNASSDGFERATRQPMMASDSQPTTNIRRKVLIVDDNVVNRKILGKMLSYYDIAYEQAVNGLDAVEKVRESLQSSNTADHYGLVFMDLSMPVMDGFQAIATIREDHAHLPIVALTANALSQEKERAFSVGATDFRTKPILRHDLYAACQRYLSE